MHVVLCSIQMSVWKNNHLHDTETHKLSNALTKLTSHYLNWHFFIELSDSNQSTWSDYTVIFPFYKVFLFFQNVKKFESLYLLIENW